MTRATSKDDDIQASVASAEWVSVIEAAKLLMVSDATIQRLADSGKLTSFRLPGSRSSRRIDKASVLAMMEDAYRKAGD